MRRVTEIAFEFKVSRQSPIHDQFPLNFDREIARQCPIYQYYCWGYLIDWN